MGKKVRIVLPQERYKGAPATDLNEKVNLQGDSRGFTETDRNIRVDLMDVFNDERQGGEQYRIFGKITPFFANAYSGSTHYDPLLESLYITQDPLISNTSNWMGYPPYDEFAFIRRDVTKDVAAPDGSTSEHIGNNHREVFPYNAGDFNWNLCLSYVYDKRTDFPITYSETQDSSISFLSGDGLPVNIVFDFDQRLAVCTAPVAHGLSDSDHVLIQGTLFPIESLGNEVHGSEKNVFNIQLLQISGTTSGGLHVFKRVIDENNVAESTSQYYVHLHRVIGDAADFTVDKCGFESSIFRDVNKLNFENPNGSKEVFKEKERREVLLYHLKDPLPRPAYNNNFDVPVNEVYVSVLLRNAMGFFTPPKVGWNFHFHDNFVDQHFAGTGSTETALPYVEFDKGGYNFMVGNPLASGATLVGALVEYNKYELQERIVSEAQHKFCFDQNVFDHDQSSPDVYAGASPENPFGYFYQPHYRITLKQYSSYIEQSTTKDIFNFPANAIYFVKDKVWKWRDLYEHGYIDDQGKGVDYPFINGHHYLKFDIRFYLRSEYHYQNKGKIITPFANPKYRNEC